MKSLHVFLLLVAFIAATHIRRDRILAYKRQQTATHDQLFAGKGGGAAITDQYSTFETKYRAGSILFRRYQVQR
jgi:hypothetical protein